jgi:hypothetical protein
VDAESVHGALDVYWGMWDRPINKREAGRSNDENAR